MNKVCVAREKIHNDICVLVCACVYACVCAFVHVCVCTHVCVIMCLHTSISVNACMHACTIMCATMYICVHKIMHMCIPASSPPHLKGQVHLNTCMLCSEEEPKNIELQHTDLCGSPLRCNQSGRCTGIQNHRQGRSSDLHHTHLQNIPTNHTTGKHSLKEYKLCLKEKKENKSERE